MHLAVGFDNGTIEIRKHRTGELLHSVKAGDKPIQKLFYYDYRLSGEKSSSGGKQLIAVDSEGNVKGFTVSANIKQFELQVQSEAKIAADEVLHLNQKKIELINQLTQLQDKKKLAAEMESKGDHQRPPTEDQILITRAYDLAEKCVRVVIQLKKPGWIIKSVIALSEAIFEGGSHVIQPLGSG